MMQSKTHIFRQMALTPKVQLRKMLVGTLGSLFCMIILVATSEFQTTWSFYSLVFLAVVSMLYAIPGYIGIWVWRMRKFLFDMD